MSPSLAAFRMHTLPWTNKKEVEVESALSPSPPLCASSHLVEAAELPTHGFRPPPPNGVDRNGCHAVGWDATPALLLDPLQ